LIHSPRQLDRIRDCLSDAARCLAEAATLESLCEIEVADLSCRPLGELSSENLYGEGDRVAGVSCGLHGSLSGTAVFAMEPEDAFAWMLSSCRGEDPLESFVASGERIIREFVHSTGPTEPSPELAAGSLREESLMEILVGTHAPSDTLVLSARLVLRTTQLRHPGSFHLLVAPKEFGHLGAPVAEE
jgi:hypothetical protein